MSDQNYTLKPLETNQDWADLEKHIKQWCSQKLQVDGYEISIHLMRNKMKLNYFIYVNGEFCGGWTLEDCEERRRFMYKTIRHIHKRSFLKGFSKKEIKKFNLDRTVDSHTPFWSSFNTMKRHLINNNKSIQLIIK